MEQADVVVAEPDFKLADHLAGKESPADDDASVDDAQAGSESKEAELMDEKGADDKQSIAVSYTASPDPVLDEPTLAAETEVQAEQAPAALIDAVADEVALVQPEEAAALRVDEPVFDMSEPQQEAEVTLEPQQAVIVDEPQQQAVVDEPQQQAVIDEQEQSVPIHQADIIAEASIEPIEPAAAAPAEEDVPVPTVIEQEAAAQPVEAVSNQHDVPAISATPAPAAPVAAVAPAAAVVVKKAQPPSAAVIDSVNALVNAKPAARANGPTPKSLNDLVVAGLTALCKSGLDIAKDGEDAAVSWLGRWLISNNPNKPVVSSPAPSAYDVSAPEEQVAITFALGIPYGSDQVAAQLSSSSYELVSVQQLLQQEFETGGEFAPVIHKARQTHSEVSTSVILSLLEKQLQSTHASRVLVWDWLPSLDQAMALESQISKNLRFVFFGQSDDAIASTHLASSFKGNSADAAALQAALIASEGHVTPLLRHYRQFNRVHTVSFSTRQPAATLVRKFETILSAV